MGVGTKLSREGGHKSVDSLGDVSLQWMEQVPGPQGEQRDTGAFRRCA